MRTAHVLVMLNRYPYATGHLMVAPRQHAANLFDSKPDILTGLIRLAAASQRILSDSYHPDGFNVGMNFGQAAGAGFADHYHMHVVPRWEGDSNFMSVTGDTRLVPETLEDTYQKLLPKFSDLERQFIKADEA